MGIRSLAILLWLTCIGCTYNVRESDTHTIILHVHEKDGFEVNLTCARLVEGEGISRYVYHGCAYLEHDGWHLIVPHFDPNSEWVHEIWGHELSHTIHGGWHE